MGCLFCGKDIGAFRLLRDDEFCSATHRKQYSARLGKALGQIAAPEPPPAGRAAFRITFPIKEGNARYSGNLVFGHPRHPARTHASIPVNIQPTLGDGFASSTWPASRAPRASESLTRFAADPSWGTPAYAASLPPPPPAVTRSRSLPAAGAVRLDTCPPHAGVTPALCGAARWSASAGIRFPEFGLAPDMRDFGAEPLAGRQCASGAAACFTNEAARSSRDAAESCEITPAPAGPWSRCVSAEPAARLVWPAEAAARFAAAALRLPDWRLLAIVPPHVESSAEYLQVPAAEPAMVDLVLSAASRIAAFPVAALRLPLPVLQPVADEALALNSIAVAGAVPLPATLAAKSLPVAEAFEAAPSAPTAVLRLPQSMIHAVAGEALTLENLGLADPAAPPAAAPVESMPAIAAFQAVPLPASAALRLPDSLPPAVEPSAVSEPALADPAAAPAAWPVESMPAIAAFQAAPLPALPQIRAAGFAAAPRANLASSAALPAWPVESMPAVAAFAPAPVAATPAPALPHLGLQRSLDFAAAAFGDTVPAAAVPAAAETAGAGIWQPMPALALRRPSTVESRSAAAIPEPGFVEMEFHCQRGPAPSVVERPEWRSLNIELALPRFGVRPILARPGDLLAQKHGTLSMARILTMPRASGISHRMGHAAKIAACLLAVLAIWMGSRMVTGGNPTVAVNRPPAAAAAAPAPDNAAGPSGHPAANAGDVADAAPVVSEPSRLEPKGPFARVRRAIARRAAVELTDNFEKGMQAWGSAAKSWPAGWQHSPDGYIKTGPLALYKPARDFRDYKLEFFGQIEDKSMGWVVRARDKKNFYAMKFTVIASGLRPIIAMVHYPVVGGKNGHRVEIPLNVMVHNNTPYHVAVDVRGNRITTTIEGQEVDSWTDGTLVAGGVGFFSDAGERARLYWMRVSKNQDVLGHICAYLSGGKGSLPQVTADLWHTGIPGLPGQPDSQDIAFAAALGLSPGGRRRRVKDSKRKRNQPWNS